VLRRIFGPERDQVRGELRKVHSMELHHQILLGRSNQGELRWVEHVACMREGRNVYRVLVGKPKGKRPLENQGIHGRMGSKWALGLLVGGSVEWIHLAWGRD
jgi:hypothetical protein